MLPPQLQQGVRPRSLSMPPTMTIASSASSMLRHSASAAQTRNCWGWKRQADYASHIDPQFQRFCRYRTLKTKAKLLDKLRRRGRWDWDVGQHPFFNPRHVRLASHVGRPRWRYNEDGGEKQETDKEATEEEGYELSRREKQWKEQMETMRKRIERDPYEAVFGKRFLPFWSPLVPTWMREEMGLSHWTKPKEATTSYKLTSVEPTATAESNSNTQSKRDADAVHPNGQLTEYAYPENKEPASKSTDPDSPNGQLTSYSYSSQKKPASESPDSPNGQLTSYSYTSATSWDSWTKTARKDEWDSVSGQRRRFEYDPISNRMVQIQVPVVKRGEVNEVSADSQTATKNNSKAPPSASVNVTTDAPERKSVESRKSISVPTETAESSERRKTTRYFPSLINSANVTLDGGPAAISEYPEKALDTLTADDIRASIGKSKQDRVDAAISETKNRTELVSTQPEHSSLDSSRSQSGDETITEGGKLDTALDRASSRKSDVSRAKATFALQPAVQRMQSKELPVAVEPDDSAAHESTGEAADFGSANVPKGWEEQADLLQADRVQRTRGSSPKITKPKETPAAGVSRWIDIMNARKAVYDAEVLAKQVAAEARDAEKNAKLRKASSMLDAEVKEQKLRLMAHENRYAHGALADIQQKLQAATSKSTKSSLDEQKERERYQQKIRDLRNELDTSFKQSSVTSEMHLERIRDLEKELTARSFGHDTLQIEKERYKQETMALKEELDRTFKQSSVNSEMQIERIRELERELDEARNASAKPAKGIEATRGEGDFCVNVTKYAKDNSKWYKKPCYVPQATGKPTRAEMEEAQCRLENDRPTHEIQDIYEGNYRPVDTMKAERLSTEKTLADEIKDIYESTYGPIDTMKAEHTPADPTLVDEIKDAYESRHGAIDTMKAEPQVVEVETDVDLGKALADYEKQQESDFQQPQRTLEAEIAAEEKAAHEAQALLDPYPLSCEETSQPRAIKPFLDQDVHGTRIVDGESHRVLSSGVSGDDTSAPSWKIQWEEPPVYKILAHDSGNDLLTTAVTSSNVTGNEMPISIPEALSQLYQPARFVPHFAELQREGFQVIYGAKDLLVFKKVKSTGADQTEPALDNHAATDKINKSDTAEVKSYPAGVNPIDGMSHSIEPSTGSFASPTGFVGDRWDAFSKSETGSSPSAITQSSSESTRTETRQYPDGDIDIRHYPRVKREEHVFSGSRLGRTKNAKREVKDTRRKWRGWRGRIRWALSIGFGAGAVAYGVGAIAERKQSRDVERWQEILDGKRSRWE